MITADRRPDLDLDGLPPCDFCGGHEAHTPDCPVFDSTQKKTKKNKGGNHENLCELLRRQGPEPGQAAVPGLPRRHGRINGPRILYGKPRTPTLRRPHCTNPGHGVRGHHAVHEVCDLPPGVYKFYLAAGDPPVMMLPSEY